MENLSGPGQGNSQMNKTPQPSRLIMSTDELVEWVMDFLTSQHLSDEEMMDIWSEEVYFSIPHEEE
jgi:hypothetical protein